MPDRTTDYFMAGRRQYLPALPHSLLLLVWRYFEYQFTSQSIEAVAHALPVIVPVVPSPLSPTAVWLYAENWLQTSVIEAEPPVWPD